MLQWQAQDNIWICFFFLPADLVLAVQDSEVAGTSVARECESEAPLPHSPKRKLMATLKDGAESLRIGSRLVPAGGPRVGSVTCDADRTLHRSLDHTSRAPVGAIRNLRFAAAHPVNGSENRKAYS
jgi:hypothetical protein